MEKDIENNALRETEHKVHCLQLLRILNPNKFVSGFADEVTDENTLTTPRKQGLEDLR